MAKTLRLVIPQWQGGDNPPYYFGSKLLAWLAPQTEHIPQVEVPIVKPSPTDILPEENGVVGQTVLLDQLHATEKLLKEYSPDCLIVFGGDCLVSQAPFSYLNERYNGNLGILWLDAHPDISTPSMFNHEHAMVLGNLLGDGDPLFAAEVPQKIKAEKVLYGGLQEVLPAEASVISRLNLNKVGAETLKVSSQPILDWIQEENIEHLAIHFDLDVLDPTLFYSILPNEPNGEPFDAALGAMTLAQVARIIQDVSKATDVVGLSLAEYFPWDAIELHNFLSELPIFKES